MQQTDRLGQERKGWGVKLSSGAAKDPAQELSSLASFSHRVPARAALLVRPLRVLLVKCMVLNISHVGKRLRESDLGYSLGCE